MEDGGVAGLSSMHCTPYVIEAPDVVLIRLPETPGE